MRLRATWNNSVEGFPVHFKRGGGEERTKPAANERSPAELQNKHVPFGLAFFKARVRAREMSTNVLVQSQWHI